MSLAVAWKAGIFGVVTHDELQGNEVFVGSFASGQIIKSWSLGRGRTATQLGQTSLSLSDDGARIAVSVLPDGNSIPKGFNNLRLYNSGNGEMVKSIRTDGFLEYDQIPSSISQCNGARIEWPLKRSVWPLYEPFTGSSM